tara:strand:+ start:9194 stop:9580 length:387 start_codon:yes stop_codon:yes gene_type:complete
MAKVYWIDKDNIAIADSDNSGNLTGPTAGTITMHVSRHDAPFVKESTGANNSKGVRIEHGMSQSPIIPVEFHEALCYKAIAHGYEKKGEIAQAEYFLRKFERIVADGKKEANSHKSEESSIVIIGEDF